MMKKIGVSLAFSTALLLLSSCTVPAYYQEGKPGQPQNNEVVTAPLTSSSSGSHLAALPDYFDAWQVERLSIAEGYKRFYYFNEPYQTGDRVDVDFVDGSRYYFFIGRRELVSFDSSRLGASEVKVRVGPLIFSYFVNIVKKP